MALAAVIASTVLGGGFTAGASTATEAAQRTPSPASTILERPIAPSPPEHLLVSALGAVRGPTFARSPARPPLRVLLTPFLAVGGALALVVRRAGGLGRVYELAGAGGRTVFGPPCGRAPPSALAS